MDPDRYNRCAAMDLTELSSDGYLSLLGRKDRLKGVDDMLMGNDLAAGIGLQAARSLRSKTGVAFGNGALAASAQLSELRLGGSTSFDGIEHHGELTAGDLGVGLDCAPDHLKHCINRIKDFTGNSWTH